MRKLLLLVPLVTALVGCSSSSDEDIPVVKADKTAVQSGQAHAATPPAGRAGQGTTFTP